MNDVRRVTVSDPGYPQALTDLEDPPAFVDLRGCWPEGGAAAVAIVGSRRASEAGRQVARTLASAAAEVGVWVVSGGAIGIDAAAHQGALDGGGPTLAVLGTSLAAPGPRSNRGLFDAILESGGGWMSEVTGRPQRLDFCRRNRLIAALTPFVLVVEGQAGSGTQYTLRAGRRLGRHLGAVTWAPGDPRGAQASWVFARGGTPIDGPDALLRWFGRRRRRKATEPARTIDELAHVFGMSAHETLIRMTELELDGRVEVLGDGRYRLR